MSDEEELGAADSTEEERRILDALLLARRLQRELKPPERVDDPERLRNACSLLDEIQARCLRYLRRSKPGRHRRWAADVLMQALYERHRLDSLGRA